MLFFGALILLITQQGTIYGAAWWGAGQCLARGREQSARSREGWNYGAKLLTFRLVPAGFWFRLSSCWFQPWGWANGSSGPACKRLQDARRSRSAFYAEAVAKPLRGMQRGSESDLGAMSPGRRRAMPVCEVDESMAYGQTKAQQVGKAYGAVLAVL